MHYAYIFRACFPLHCVYNAPRLNAFRSVLQSLVCGLCPSGMVTLHGVCAVSQEQVHSSAWQQQADPTGMHIRSRVGSTCSRLHFSNLSKPEQTC